MMLAVFGFAIFSAFAFNMPKAEGELTTFIGHVQTTPTKCDSKDVECSDVNNNRPCMFGAVQLRKLGATTCGSLLWEIDQ